MKYGITLLVLGAPPIIEIKEDEYTEIKTAKESLIECLYLEQKADLVMEDYLEYEMMLLSYSAGNLLFHNYNYSRFHNEVNNINRRIVNLLSACRLYLDHCMHHLKNIYGATPEKIDDIINQKKIEYDSNLGFRVLEALRNHVQHRGFPVQKVRYNSQREKEKGKDEWDYFYSLTPLIRVKELEEDKKFKKTTLKELKKMGEEIDIKPFIKEYITSIGNIHKKVRGVIKDDIQCWENTLQGCIKKYKVNAGSKKSILGLGIVMQEEEGIWSESVPVFTDFIKLRQELESKNSFAGTLGRHYVTNQPIK